MKDIALGMAASWQQEPARPSSALVRRAQNGDMAAFEDLLRLNERAVLSTAYRLLGSLADAQDAAQEVFLRLHKCLKSVDPSRELSPWLYRVTVNVCRDIGRHRRRDVLLEEAFDSSQARPSTAEGDLLNAQNRKVLHQGLQTLTERERAAVVLRDVQGISTTEAARILGVREATVRSQISAARLKLKRYVEARLRGTL